MKRFLAPFFGLLLASAAHAQSGLLPANQVWAGPPSGGQGFARARALVSADLPALSPGGLSLASGQIMVGQVSGFAGAVALSGDCTIVASGAITCIKTNGVAFGALATTTPGTGVATALGVAIGSAGAPVINGGALGTPSSGTLTNATGLPVAGISGLGTGTAAALGTAVGSAGAVVVNGGALGTPSSGVGTNLTALNASNLNSGTVAAARGGAGTIAGALKGSGAGVVTQAACADLSNGAASCSTDATNATNIITGTLAVARGGFDPTAWTTFAPSLTCGTAVFSLASARSKTVGKTTFVSLDFAITTLGTCTAAVTLTLPNTPQSGGGLAGQETQNSGIGVTCRVAASITSSLCFKATAANFVLNDHIVVSGVYENQ